MKPYHAQTRGNFKRINYNVMWPFEFKDGLSFLGRTKASHMCWLKATNMKRQIWKDFNIKLSSWKPYVIYYAKTPLYKLQSTFFLKQTFASWQQLLWILCRSWFSNTILTRFGFITFLTSQNCFKNSLALISCNWNFCTCFWTETLNLLGGRKEGKKGLLDPRITKIKYWYISWRSSPNVKLWF